MFALDIDLNVLLGICVALGVLCLILLFHFVAGERRKTCGRMALEAF